MGAHSDIETGATLSTAAAPSVPKGISTYVAVVNITVHLLGAVGAIVTALVTTGQTQGLAAAVAAVLSASSGFQSSRLSAVRGESFRTLVGAQAALTQLDSVATTVQGTLAGAGTNHPATALWPSAPLTDVPTHVTDVDQHLATVDLGAQAVASASSYEPLPTI